MTGVVSIGKPLVRGRLLNRKRFILSVSIDGKRVKAFLPNTARLSEILTPNCELLLKPVPSRKSAPFDALVGLDRRVPVVIDSRIPNMLIREALDNKDLPAFRHYMRVLSEVNVGSSRIDFKLENGRTCFVEVKGVTLAENRIALYPDAPTERGQRHLKLLTSLAQSGHDAVVLFFAMRADVTAFEVNSSVDGEFARLLRKSEENKVKVMCYTSAYRQGTVKLGHKLVYNSRME